jgi:hypothetical protein
MKRKHFTFLAFVTTFAWTTALAADQSLDPQQDCPRQLKFELGDSEFTPGDSIAIQELRGSSDIIQRGGIYCVIGTYTLASEDQADLSFFATTTNRTPTPIDPQQTMRVAKGSGSFRLMKRMTEDGYLHVTFYSRKNGQGFGGVYFGQGEGVLKEKHFTYRAAGAHSAAEALSATGPNQVLFNYLGNPVDQPADMNPAYSKDGLTQAMQTAAERAGVSLAKLQIDDSEFPFLIGVEFANPNDKPKVIEQIRKMAPYATSGGVGGETSYAMNIVPYHAFPPEDGRRIYRRMTLREAVLHDRITGVQ